MQDFIIDSKLLAMQELGEHFRHSLHKIPEVSGAEYKTSAFCQDVLKKAGFKITTFEGYTGFLADLDKDCNLPRIAIRADMDALEMNDLEKLSCNVRFIFQMAEEKAHIPGANKMVELGCMEGVDEVYALHNDASLEYGSVKINNGIMSSFGTIWNLSIQGRAAHSSTPHKGLDAIYEGARILMDMEHIIAKKTDPFAPAVFSCGVFQGGSIPNGIAESALLKGTIRAMDGETNKILKNAFREIEEQSALRGFKTQFSYDGYPAIFNHAVCVQRLVESAQKVLKNHNMLFQSCEPMSASEDFSYMIEACRDKKGAMYFLGSGNTQKGICNYLHSNPYYVEDKAILVGAQIWINLILSFGK